MRVKYVTSWLVWDKAEKILREKGLDPEEASMWDHVEEPDIEDYEEFKSLDDAKSLAERSYNLDIFKTPRVETFEYDKKWRCWQITERRMYDVDLGWEDLPL